jgi:hypothetical protein
VNFVARLAKSSVISGTIFDPSGLLAVIAKMATFQLGDKDGKIKIR